MHRRSAFDCVGNAFDRMSDTLFRPFRFDVWAKLALIVFLAGELGGGGNFNGISNLRNHPHSQDSTPLRFPPLTHEKLVLFATIAAVIAVVLFAFFAVFAYLNARSRFVLMDSVIARDCSLSQMWTRWRIPANGYFLFNIAVGLVSFSVFAAVGLMVVRALSRAGVFSGRNVDIFQLFTLLAAPLAMFLTCALVVALVNVFAKDFVVPIMGFEGRSLGNACDRLAGIVRAEPGAFTLYIVAKIVLSIAGAIISMIAFLILLLICAIPIGMMAAAWALAFRGQTGLLVMGAILLVAVLVPVILFAIAFCYVPMGIFFEAFALEFLSDRLPPLKAALHPPSTPIPPASFAPVVPAPVL